MPLPTLQKLEAATLSLLVFGPGFGESILIRTPEGRWAAIDSAQRGQPGEPAINPARRILEDLGVNLDLLVLTHPHLDHAKGFRDLLELAGPECVVAAVEPLMREPSPSAIATDPDDVGSNEKGIAISTHVAIQNAWNDGLGKWNLRAESTLDVGGCTFEVLAPDDEELSAFRESRLTDLNEVSAAMRVTWGDEGDLVLGADAGPRAWGTVERRIHPGDLLPCVPVKVPHHGSRKSIHPLLLSAAEPPPTRPMVLTPWNGRGTLPRFDPGEGAELLLRATDALELTAFPFGKIGASPISVADVFSALEVTEIGDNTDAGGIRLQFDQPSLVDHEPGVLEAWVLIQVKEGGEIDVERGSSAVQLIG
jgi:beta-lactamase superfamily II metal-dependent hydrolase